MEWAYLEGADLKSRLNERLSTQFERLGLIWRGDYYWVEQGDLSSRRVVKFQRLKGLSAVLTWGLSLGFVPAVSGSGLSYHRTLKAARLDLFEGTHSYATISSDRATREEVHILVDRFDRSLTDYTSGVLPRVVSWFGRVRGLDEITTEAERQIRVLDRRNPTHHPSPAYVLAFVKAAMGQVDVGREILKHAMGVVNDDLWLRLEKALESAKARSN